MDMRPFVNQFNIMRYILFKYSLDGELITNLKMQKVLYYVYVWHLVINGKHCFNEKFQAWPNGPVLPSIYSKLKKFKARPISTNLIEAKGKNLSEAIDNFHKEIGNDVISTVDEVYEKYGQYSAFQLVNLTHNDLAWQKARGELGPTETSNKQLSDDDIIEFYSLKLENEQKKA